MAMKPHFPENWFHCLAEREARDAMQEGTSFQPFEARCDGLVALISTSLFESDGWLLVFLKSTVRIPQQPDDSAFSQSFAFSYGEKLRTRLGQNDPGFWQCFIQQAQHFLHRNCCVFPRAIIATFSWSRIRVILGLPASLAVLSCAVELLYQLLLLQKKDFFEWLGCDCHYFFLSGSPTSP